MKKSVKIDFKISMDLDFNSNAGIPTKPHAIIAKTTIAIIQFLIIFAYAF